MITHQPWYAIEHNQTKSNISLFALSLPLSLSLSHTHTHTHTHTYNLPFFPSRVTFIILVFPSRTLILPKRRATEFSNKFWNFCKLRVFCLFQTSLTLKHQWGNYWNFFLFVISRQRAGLTVRNNRSTNNRGYYIASVN